VSRALAAAIALAAVAAGSACGPPTSGTPVDALWREHCAGCHAADGHGNPAMRGLDPGVDLTRSRLIGDRSRGLVFQRIAYGYGSMPGFAHKLPQGDIELLVAYVTKLKGR
jgi:mono/diheme cytochrome c family protein